MRSERKWHTSTIQPCYYLDTGTSRSVILAAQKQDPSIGRVLACKLNGQKPAICEIAKELPYTRKLLCEWPKVEIGSDGLLQRKSGHNLQLVLPKQFHRLVYKELNQEMGHLGTERVLQLA